MVNLLLLCGAARTREISVRLHSAHRAGGWWGRSEWKAMLLALLSSVIATLLAIGALRVLQHMP